MKIPKDSEANIILDKAEGGGGIWGFKGEMGNSQVAQKVANTFFLGNSNNGTEGNLVIRFLQGSFLYPYLIPMCSSECAKGLC